MGLTSAARLQLGPVQLLAATLLALVSSPHLVRARRVVTIEVPFHIRTHQHIHTVFRPAPAPTQMSLVPVPVHVPVVGPPPQHAQQLTAFALLTDVPRQQARQSRPVEVHQLHQVHQLPAGQHESQHQQVSYQRSEHKSHVYR